MILKSVFWAVMPYNIVSLVYFRNIFSPSRPEITQAKILQKQVAY
jgi:hypothetical protein